MRPTWVAWLALSCLALASLTVALTASIPGAAVPDEVTAAEHRRLLSETGVRNTVVQALAGLVIVVGLGLTARSLYISRETHLTDRLTHAVDQLGHAEPSVRLGGVHSLRRLARNSPADREMVAEVLGGYLRIKAGPGAIPPIHGAIDADVQGALTTLVELRA